LVDIPDLVVIRHIVSCPAKLAPEVLEAGYWQACGDFYRWGSIWRGAATKPTLSDRLRHLVHTGGWKKFEPLWDGVIRAKQTGRLLTTLEPILAGFGQHPTTEGDHNPRLRAVWSRLRRNLQDSGK
jgi:hypothetical protein